MSEQVLENSSENKIYRVTIDVESDWGGRSDRIEGIRQGLPKIITMLWERKIKGLFFISTELLEDFGLNHNTLNEHMPRILKHETGSHGHFHVKYNNQSRIFEDKRLSEQVLEGYGVSDPPYRPPRFNKLGQNLCLPYSNPKNHISLLKCAWFNARPKKDDIFYLHPFDIVGGSKSPNMFCKLWYSRPKKALQVLENVLDSLKGENQLK